nr:MAG TPA: hypothetical protein [Caudoviricetes sp.]
MHKFLTLSIIELKVGEAFASLSYFFFVAW